MVIEMSIQSKLTASLISASICVSGCCDNIRTCDNINEYKRYDKILNFPNYYTKDYSEDIVIANECFKKSINYDKDEKLLFYKAVKSLNGKILIFYFKGTSDIKLGFEFSKDHVLRNKYVHRIFESDVSLGFVKSNCFAS